MEEKQLRRTDVAAEVRALLARHNVAKQSLADGTDIKIATLRQRLNGTKPFRMNEIDRIAYFFSIRPADLIGSAQHNAGASDE